MRDRPGMRRLVGIAREAGLAGVAARMTVIERRAPLTPLAEEYFRSVVFEGT